MPRVHRKPYTLVVLRPVPFVANWTPAERPARRVGGVEMEPLRVRRWSGDYQIDLMGSGPWVFWWPFTDEPKEFHGDRPGTGQIEIYDHDGHLCWTRRINGWDRGDQRVPAWLHIAAAEDGAEALGIPVPIFKAMYTADPPAVWMPR